MLGLAVLDSSRALEMASFQAACSSCQRCDARPLLSLTSSRSTARLLKSSDAAMFNLLLLLKEEAERRPGERSSSNLGDHPDNGTENRRQRLAGRAGPARHGAVTLVFSVTFLTLFGLIDEPRVRSGIGSLLYRDSRERYERLADRIIKTTSRYMLGNLAISLICGTIYGITAVILGLPHAFALAVIAEILDLIPSIGALLAGIIIGIVALSVSLGALIAFVIVIVVYQQIENYVLQPTIIGRTARVSGFTVIVSVLVFGSLFGVIGAIIGVPLRMWGAPGKPQWRP
jgi:predicted PurR-regulated permease PerM